MAPTVRQKRPQGLASMLVIQRGSAGAVKDIYEAIDQDRFLFQVFFVRRSSLDVINIDKP